MQSDGHTQIGSAYNCPLGFASYGQIAQAGEEVDAGTDEGIDVILYQIGTPLLNAEALEQALGSNTGHFELNGAGVLREPSYTSCLPTTRLMVMAITESGLRTSR